MRMNALRVSREYTEQHEYDAALRALRIALDGEELAKGMKAGSRWTEDEAVAAAHAI
jgi:hypothetical protein